MKQEQFIQKLIHDIEIESNRYSILNLAIRDARLITGRDIETGELLKNELFTNSLDQALDQYSFIGIVNYLLILYLIGTAFSKKTI